jgi:hypothetical protein
MNLRPTRILYFVRGGKKSVRTICSWPVRKWLIYDSKTSRYEWFKVVSFVDEHCCPSKRDKKLVTSLRNAKFYFKEIRDNPTLKVSLVKKEALKDMIVVVSLSKCKRTKSLVLKTTLDSMKGEYTRVYDYQLELLRSNLEAQLLFA